jgi:hypothetical protein
MGKFTADKSEATEPASCGEGLAAHASFPLKLGEVMDAMAENLEAHITVLDLSDSNSKPQYDAYRGLAQQHRKLAESLKAVGEQMAGYRSLPMGRHDEAAMSGLRIVEAFRDLVEREQELLALLGERVTQHRGLLDRMNRPA